MSFRIIETSQQSALPLLLFEFRRGSNVWRYTTDTNSVDAFGETWDPSSITLGTVSQTNEPSRDRLGLSLPNSNPFAATFLGLMPQEVSSVTVFRGHATDPDLEWTVYWKGRVAGVVADDERVMIDCEPVFASLKRAGLSARYQSACRHALYQQGCNANKADFAVEVSVSAIDGKTVTYSSVAAIEDDYLVGGMIELSAGDVTFIVSHTATTLFLIRPFPALVEALAQSSPVPVTATVYPGCDHSPGTCSDRFNNAANYGGFPFIPSKNPFGGSSIV